MSEALVVEYPDDAAPGTSPHLDIRDVTDAFLGEGDTLIDVTFSSLNYKDAMALAGDRGVMRTNPLIPGIDVVGIVSETTSDRLAPGDSVVLNGAGLGEFRHGGYTTRLRVESSSIIVLPEGISPWEAAAIGTAGYTAALCVLGLLDHGLKPEDGPILVTGATGGVGSIAILLLKKRGFETVALTGRVAEHGTWLRELGADAVEDRAGFAERGRPLQKARFAGVVDTLGSHALVNALAQLRWGGVATACGLAQGADLPATVLPFILRGVILQGINSVDAPLELRRRAWELLAQDLDRDRLAEFTETLPLSQVAAAGADLLAGQRRGRAVVDVRV